MKQSEIIEKLNEIILESLAKFNVDRDKRKFFPTGDGMCIAIYNYEGNYDTHLLIALKILQLIEEYKNSISDESRRFQIRIGLNENIDNWIMDINGNPNIAGEGINLAQKIMDQAGASQILMGHTPYKTLVQREKYSKNLIEYNAADKHNMKFSVYQYVKADCLGLINNIPDKLQKIPLSQIVERKVKENEEKDQIEILYAVYGSSKKKPYVATQQLMDKAEKNKLLILASNDIAGDPDSGNPDKWLYVCYSFRGKIHLKFSKQGNFLEIPGESDLLESK